MACGNREIETTTDTGRYLVSLAGPLMGGWDYRVGVSSAFSKSKAEAAKRKV